MIEFLRPLAFRLTMVIAPRAVVTMVGGGVVAGFGSQIIDLRGQLPTSIEKHYGHRPVENIKGVVWHHSATRGQSIHTIAEYHIEVRGWPGIAYHYAIGWDGVVYALNSPETISYQSEGYNSKTIGVVLIGNYEERDLTPEMEASIIKLNDYLHGEFNLQFAWLHRDTKSTLCPGRYATEFLRPYLYGALPGK